MQVLNRKFFYDSVRASLFRGKLKQSQVNGMSAFLDYLEANHAGADDRWLAYILGTAHHEVDRRMLPIKEYGSEARFFRLYDKDGENPRLAARLGNTQDGDGVRYHGRGFVQITGRDNYTRMGKRINVDLVNHPEKTLELETALKTIFIGMVEGVFTGKSLEDYFTSDKEQWVNARRIVNGRDKAHIISDFAQRYYEAIAYIVV